MGLALKKISTKKPALYSLVAIGALVAGTAAAVVPRAFAQTNDLQCFSGSVQASEVYNGTCTLTENGAVLNTIDNDSDPGNAYAGVYYAESTLSGKLVGEVDAFSFDYAAAEGTVAAGGSPRVSIPFDNTNDGVADGYIYIDTLGCNDGDASTGTMDVVNDPSCLLWYNDTSYANWAEFVAANGDVRIATSEVPFIVVDQPGEYTISNVVIGLNESEPVTDTVAPTAPTNLRWTNPNVVCGGTTTSGSITAAWDAATDNTGVVGYEYQVMTPNRTSWDAAWSRMVTDTSRVGGFTDGEGDYTFRVRAVDAAGNYSNWSEGCVVTYDVTPAPATKEQCKDGGWKALFTDEGKTFKNQGQCVADTVASENSALRR